MAITRTSTHPLNPQFDKRLFGIDNKEKKKELCRFGVEKKDILDSWKDISSYLGRNKKTCQRWEKQLGLPIHRYDEDSSRSKVFAYRPEIDEWLENRKRAVATAPKSFLGRKWTIFGPLTFVVLAFALLAIFSLFDKSPSSLLSQPSIAVVPFENINPSGYENYISEGMTNELINNLTRLDKVRVTLASPTARPDDPAEFQEGMSVPDYTLRGKLNKEEDKLWISIQLVRENDQKRIWDKVYEGKPEDIISIQDQFFKELIDRLNADTGKNLSNTLSKGKTRDYMAFNSYLKGSYLLNKSDEQNDDSWKLYHEGKYHSGKWTQESNELAINLFHRAIELDKNFAEAYIGLAECYANNVNFSWDYKKEWLDKAEELTKQAQTLSPDLPEYYSTLSETYILKYLDFGENTRDQAFEIALEGVEKYPNHPRLISLAGYCYYAKFGEEGNEEDFEKALEYKEKSFYLDPHGLRNIGFAELLMLKRDFARALGVCSIIEPLDDSLMVRFRRGEIYYYSGDLERSKAVFQQIDMPLDLKIHSLFYLGMIAAQKGERDEALGKIREIGILKPQDYRYYIDELNLASIYFGIGEKEFGYQNLVSFFNDNPYSETDKYLIHKYIDLDRNFNRYREEERFKKILEGENPWLGAKEFP